MRTPRKAAVRRWLADLRRAETRGSALRRLRRRAVPGSTGKAPGRARGATPERIAGTAVAAPAATRRPDAWYVGEWSRLAAAVSGPQGPDGKPVVDPGKAPDVLRLADRQRAEADLAAAIARGESLEQAVCRSVAALADTGEWGAWNAGWALAEGVARLPGGATASGLGHIVLLHRRRQFERAWTIVRDLDDAALAAHVPVEAVDAALAAGTAEGLQRALSISVPTDDMEAPVLVDLAGRFLAFGERARAAELVAALRHRSSVELDPRRRHSWELIDEWLAPRGRSIPEGSVPVAVMGYRTPDHGLTSGNVGDYIQTLAMLGNLARMTGVTFTGEDGLGPLATELQGRVQPGLRLPDVSGAVHLVTVDREFSSAEAVPEGTWMVAFGWHMHPLYDLRYDFPYHPNIRPLFISFHVNRLEMLTDDAQAYLRQYGPVGCRDWNTVFLLLSAGIDAFFTGCLTTTVDAVFPTRETAYHGKGAVGVIDLPRKSAGRDARNVKVYSHQSDAYRAVPLPDGVRAASSMLAAYQQDLDRAVTGRLHAYLPLTSLGVPVEFSPGSPGDVRFAGLTGMRPGDDRLAAMRGGVRDLLATVFERVVAGAGEADVYGLWRDLTRDRVAEARTRLEAPVEDEPTGIDVAAAVATAMTNRQQFGPHDAVDRATVTDVVVAFDQNLTYPAAVLLESVVSNASGAVRLWVLARGLSDAYQEWLAAAFPAVPITFLPCDDITYDVAGPKRRIPRRITVSTMDRLLLPIMLGDVDRVVYVDVDTLVIDDICRLAATDLGGHPIAARDSNVTEPSEWQRAGRRLEEPRATELRRLMAARHGYGHAALNAGVLVLDLDRMRRDDFTSRYLGFGERYGLHDQDTMLAYVGPDRGVIDPRWNAMPVLEDVNDPSLIHWASFGKPWDPPLTYAKDRWREYAGRLRDRAGMPPTHGEKAASPSGSLGSPVPIGPVTSALSPRIERVINGVREENLSYLDVASLRTLASIVQTIETEMIEGLIIEAGTARGGSAITLAAAKSVGRRMKVYDVFGMIPPPGERDGKDVHRRYETIVSGRSKGVGGDTYYGYRDELLEEVTESFARHGLPLAANNIELVQGRFESTITLEEPVAFAHLDGDWYASTMTCLTRLTPLLAVGGRLVIDDYDTWSGCRAAVDEYFAGRTGFRFERRGRLHIVRT